MSSISSRPGYSPQWLSNISTQDDYSSKSKSPQPKTHSVKSSGLFSAAQLDQMYPPRLGDDEIIWRDRYNFFLDRGLILRPRYHPDWIPSWLATGEDPCYCEDSIEQILPMVLDAKRPKYGDIVCIKICRRKSSEVEIARYLSSDRDVDSRNHCVVIHDSFQDPFLEDVRYLVMPVLRPFNDPEFGILGEVVDFVTQSLEGLAFMHEKGVAHGDCTAENLMMDARPLFPGSWHFVADNCQPDGIKIAIPLARFNHPVRYYIIDYDFSTRFGVGQSHLVNIIGGRDSEVPEIDQEPPYDAFKIDVFALGNIFFKEFIQRYPDLDFLLSLTNVMTTQDPSKRATCQLAIAYWNQIKSKLRPSMISWRLRKHDETIGERVVLDTVEVARQGIRTIRNFFQQDTIPQ